MVGCVHSQKDLSSDVMPAFVHQVVIESPTEEQRKAMLASLSQDLSLGKDVNLAKIAKQTVVRSSLVLLIKAVCKLIVSY